MLSYRPSANYNNDVVQHMERHNLDNFIFVFCDYPTLQHIEKFLPLFENSRSDANLVTSRHHIAIYNYYTCISILYTVKEGFLISLWNYKIIFHMPKIIIQIMLKTQTHNLKHEKNLIITWPDIIFVLIFF